ncbi:hypothetical protein ABZS96_20940 [Streptomyces avermitilis]|uniref:hypothetical protein n=1 Tax=Streptomyces avermitilis TaxID=33903 RepID=UPI00339EF68B
MRPTLIDPYTFVVRRLFLTFLPEAEPGECMWCEEGNEPGEHWSLAQLFSEEWIGDPGVSLTEKLAALFTELGFCNFDATNEERQAWTEANGTPNTAASPMERAVRQLHWDTVLEGALQEHTSTLGYTHRYLPEIHHRLAEWFASLGYPVTLDITMDRPGLHDLP